MSVVLVQILTCISLIALPIRLSAQENDPTTDARINQRDQLVREALDRANRGKPNEAMELFEDVYVLEQSIFGTAHEELIGTLEQLCQFAEMADDDAALLKYCEQRYSIIGELFGNDSYRTRDAERAIADAKGRARLTGEQKAQLAKAKALYSQIVLEYQSGRYSKGIQLAKECVRLIKSVHGEFHHDYSSSLNNLALMYESLGDYPLAEEMYRSVLKIDEQLHGKNHPDYAQCLNNLAMLYNLMGDYPVAEQLLQECTKIRIEVLGIQHPDYAKSLSDQALLYKSIGDYSRAEMLCREAMSIRENLLGKMHPDYALSLNNLAGLYCAMGDYAQAEPMYREALEICQKVLGDQHPFCATTLHNLAQLYEVRKEFSQAEKLYLTAMAIDESVLGSQHPTYATSINNLAMLYEAKGDYAKAEPLLLQASEVWRKALGEQHPIYGTSVANLGRLYYSMGDAERAESLSRKALEITGKTLGTKHPHYAICLHNLAASYRNRGDLTQAASLYRKAADITLENLELTADAQSQRQQILMGNSLRYQLDNYLSLVLQEPSLQEIAYATILRWKGSVWLRQQRYQILADNPSLQSLFASYKTISSRLSTLMHCPPSDPENIDAWQLRLDELINEREQLERDLSLASTEYRQTAASTTTTQQLRECLPKETALVDFLEFDYIAPTNSGADTERNKKRRMLAYIVRADKEIRAIDLGESEPLDELISLWRQDFGGSKASRSVASKLRSRLWYPLENSLRGISTVYISPDGALGTFPLGALPGNAPGKYLLEELAIVILPVPQALPAMRLHSRGTDVKRHDRFCLIGGVDYDSDKRAFEPSQRIASNNRNISTMMAVRNGSQLSYSSLPGTVTEIEEISELIDQYLSGAHASILQGSSASEDEFALLAPQHDYLHVATHGFFAPESVKSALDLSATSSLHLHSSDPRGLRLVGHYPDLLSGLVFAGANRSTNGELADGILTAAEVQSLDLRKVRLAVLSACETGLGKSAGGEGIIGLQRAFQIAGAQATVTSLWKVDDLATRALMVEFYRNLLEKRLSKLEALRQAQIWLLNHPDAIKGKDLSTRGLPRKVKPLADDVPGAGPARSLPAYWAAFQLSGDPR